MRSFRNRRQLERELRASRPEPPAEFATALAEEVRSRPVQRTRLGRVGLAFALSGLIVIALASFGGVGYAKSAVTSHAKKATTSRHAFIISKAHSAAAAQYGTPQATYTAPKPKAHVKKAHAKGAVAAKKPSHTIGQAQAANAAPVKSGQLPFTGLALWVPLAIGLALIALGLTLRTRSRRHGSAAH